MAYRSFLDDMSPARAAELIGKGTRRPFGRGDVLLLQGGGDTGVLLVTAGWVKVVSAGAGDEGTILALRGPGDVLGEQSAIDGLPRSASVIALEAGEASYVRRDEFIAASLGVPEIGLALLRHLSRNLRESDDRRRGLATGNTLQALCQLIVAFAERFGIPHPDGSIRVRLPVNRTDLAKAAGISWRMLMRGLKLLRERGLIDTSAPGVIVVLRPEALALLAGMS